MVRDSIDSDVLSDPNYSPSEAYKGSEDRGSPYLDKLAVVFPSWHLHTSDLFYQRFMDRLTKRGYFVRAYDFSDHILEPDIEAVLESYDKIQERVSDDLENLTKNDRFEDIHFIGASLGAVALSVVGSAFPKMTGATIVAGSSNLALSMWDGIRTVGLREALEDQGVTREELDDSWAELAPSNHAPAFTNKPTRMVVSTTDKVIPTAYQLEMADALRDAGSEVSTEHTILGHYASIAYYLGLKNNIP